jgi:hypothetical protein
MQPQASVAAEICRSQPAGNVKRRAPQLAGARLATLTQHIVQLDCITAAVPPASACASCGHVLCGDADGTGMPTAACSHRRHRRITTLRVYPSGTGGSRHCVSARAAPADHDTACLPERHRRITTTVRYPGCISVTTAACLAKPPARDRTSTVELESATERNQRRPTRAAKVMGALISLPRCFKFR